VPGIIALGVIAACFGNLVASVTAQRERGVLKRRRAMRHARNGRGNA
jgi:ABC-2 type transport system permease protein